MARSEAGGYATKDADGANLSIRRAVLSPAVVATIVTAEQTFTVPEVLETDSVIGVTKPTHQSGGMPCHTRVTAANTIGITFVNPTAGGVTPTASEEYRFYVARAN